MKESKPIIMSDKIIVFRVIGWILICFFGFLFLGFLAGIGDGTGDSTFGMFIFTVSGFLVGVLLVRRAGKIKKIVVKYRRYIDVVVNIGQRNIDSIASAVSLPYDEVLENLQAMIDVGFLKDASIDHSGHRIILRPPVRPAVNTGAQSQAAAQMNTARCSGCGANNVVPSGKVSACEYCGTPITG
jgi:hypothetical protein